MTFNRSSSVIFEIRLQHTAVSAFRVFRTDSHYFTMVSSVYYSVPATGIEHKCIKQTNPSLVDHVLH
jgi:hypothetical protein